MSNSLLAIPFEDFIPQLLSRNISSSGQAFINWMNNKYSELEEEILEMYWFKLPERCPSNFLNELGYLLEAGIREGDTERQKRRKIKNAIATHKIRGSWNNDAKIRIDNIIGYSAALYNLSIADSDDAIMLSYESTDPNTYWSTMQGLERGDWSQIGSGLFIPGSMGAPDLTALNGTDVAFIDALQEDLRTYRFNGTNWAQIGNDLNIPGTSVPSLTTLNETDIAFIDFISRDLRKYRFNGTDWSQIGNDLNISTVTYPTITALNETDVAFIDSTLRNLRTYRFDGTNWSQIGNDLNILNVGIPALTTLNETDVAFIDNNNDDLRTYRFDGTNWSQIGNDLNILNVGNPTLAALNSTDVVFIDDTNKDLRTYRFDGIDWKQISNDLNIIGTSAPALAALNETDVAFLDNINKDLRTYRFSGVDDLLGMWMIGEFTESVIPGNVYIDCHEGINVSTLTQDEVDKIVAELKYDVAPAYMVIYLGYIDISGSFVIYSGGIIG